MTRVYNFSAGPAALPQEVLERLREEMLDWHGHGMSVMEMSHRGKAFVGIAQQAEADLRELLAVPSSYKVLFLQGGATAQFAGIPLNLTTPDAVVDVVNTGAWSKKAIAEAKKYCKVNVVADAASSNYAHVPPQSEWKRSPNAAYLHYTPNETIGGVEFPFVPDGDAPLVADFSSTILSRPLDVGRYGVIYAGAQKNIGPAGLVVVFDWVKRGGGLAAMAERNRAKAAKLYGAIDGSGFYRNPVAVECRSWMNVPFTLPHVELEKPFAEGAKRAGLVALEGHRSVGGMRASIYNAMPLAGVDALVEYMKEFQRTKG
ncbi:MAG: phosphoserine aminotransferase [Steroidobacteraceae bacterium]|nr:phosphoserine aminotransferase [Steroidobacteraceae bacterium]